MKVRINSFVSVFALIASLLLAPSLFAGGTGKDSKSNSTLTESERQNYIIKLLKLREISKDSEKTETLTLEIMRHPAPSSSNSKLLSSMLVGQWSSPRHDYLYVSDGNWYMLPIETGGTKGTWRIKGNEYLDTCKSKVRKSTIILLNQQYFVTTDGINLFVEKFLSKEIPTANGSTVEFQGE